MDEERMNKIIADHMPAAYPVDSECPPAEIWAAVINHDLPAEEHEKLAAHSRVCQACASEYTLAQKFLSASDRTDKDVEWIVGQLERAHRPESNVVRFPRRWPRYAQPLLGVAAAAMLVIAFAPMLPILQPGGVPVLPPDTGVYRGADVSIVQPAGELDYFPRQLEWRHHPEAQAYRLAMYGVDGEILWQTETSGDVDSVGVPDELVQRHVVYYWQVEAFSAQGDAVARSRRTEFRVSGGTR
ncbi:MAG: hypothetical protein OEQ74_03895 [Gammaproteobacteria bacterium]|nr:hypothetical protein [Gammaproteobacteria bacterium]